MYDIICMFCVSETPGDAVFFVLQMVYLNRFDKLAASMDSWKFQELLDICLDVW